MIVNQDFIGELLEHIRHSISRIDNLKGCVKALGGIDWKQDEINGYIDVLKSQLDYLKDRADDFKDKLDTLKD